LSSSSSKITAFFTFFPTGVYKIDATAKKSEAGERWICRAQAVFSSRKYSLFAPPVPAFHPPPLLTLFNGKGVNTGGTDRNLDARLQIRTTVDGFGCKKVIFFVFFHRLVARPVLRNN
jgi:hypothetical protein